MPPILDRDLFAPARKLSNVSRLASTGIPIVVLSILFAFIATRSFSGFDELSSMAAAGQALAADAASTSSGFMDTIQGWFAQLLGAKEIAHSPDERLSNGTGVLTPLPPAASAPAKNATGPPAMLRPATTTVIHQTINQPVIERVVERRESGVSEAYVAGRVEETEKRLAALIAAVSSQGNANSAQIAYNWNALGIAMRVENLSGTNISNPTITGGSVTASSITGTISNVLDSLTGAIASLTGTELTYTRASFTEATSTTFFASTLTAPSATVGAITATSSATSTFAGGVSALRLAATATSTLSGLVLDGSGLRFSTLDCSSYDNSGKLTTDASGNVVCAADQGGSGSTVGGSDTQVQFNNNGSFAGSASLTFSSSTAKLTVTNASTSNLTASYASTSDLTASNSFTLSNLTGFLKATAGAVATALVNLANDVSGVLPVANGGTGWANIAAGAIPYGNGSSALATTTAGTNGYVLAYLNGVPTWTATTTFSAPLSYSGGAVSIPAASGSTDGYLSSTDWATFNNKVATSRAVNTTYPLQGGGDLSANRTLSLAFGTTTSNTWAGTQTFTDTPVLGSLSGLVGSNNGSLYQVATSTNFVTSTTAGSGISLSGSTGDITITNAGVLSLGSLTGAVATSSLGINTDNLIEGLSNLFFTSARARSALSASSPLTYNSGTGAFGFDYSTANNWTGLNVFGQASSTRLSIFDRLYVGGTATTTILGSATSTFGAGIETTYLNVTGTAATSTFANGVALTGGCVAVNGACITSGGGGGISSLGAQYSTAQTGASQTFATSSDTNIELAITSSGNTHTFTPTWSGTLGVSRGGTGIANPTAAGILLGSYAGDAWQQIATSSLGLLTTNVAEGSNLYFTTNRAAAVLAGTTTDALTEGATNKYYSSLLFAGSLAGTTTDALVEGSTNRYYTDARVGSYISGSSTVPHVGGSAYGDVLSWTGSAWTTRATSTLAINTDSLVEGSSNLFFTSARARSALSASSPLTYNSGTGAFGFDYSTANNWTGLNVFGQASSTRLSIFDRLYVGGTATTTILGSATSTFGAGIETTYLNVTGTAATSTFANGINLSAGCFSVGGTCVGGGSGSGTVGSGTTGQFPYYAANGTTLTATSSIYLATTGYVGIGNTSPSYKLDVAGFINTDQYSGYKQGGNTILYASSTTFTTTVGQAGGPWATATSTAGLRSTAIGYQALNTTPTNATAADNTAIGYQALNSDTTGFGNTANGSYALFSNTTGYQNTANGLKALYTNTTGNNNTANAPFALFSNTTGSENVAIGYSALYYNKSATSSIAVGFTAGRGTAAYNNQGGVYLGYKSGYNAATGSDYNTLLGYQAGYDITTGANNLILGSEQTTGSGITTGSNNILLGKGVRYGLSQTGSDQLNIGNLIFATGLGSENTLSSGNVGIGDSSPTEKLTIAGPTSGITPYLKFQNESAIGTGVTLVNIATTTTSTSNLAIGLNLENSSQTDDTYSPFITFSRKSDSGSFNMPFAGIGAQRTAAGVDTNWNAGDLTFYTTASGGSGLQERLRITDAGNVGIGTTTPANKLIVTQDVSSLSTPQLLLAGATTPTLRLRLGYHTTGDYGFIDAVQEGSANKNLALQSTGGNVGIGTTSPSRKLHISGATPIIGLEDTDNGKNWIIGYDSGLTGVNFGEVGVADGRLFLDDGGNVGIGTASPSTKLEVSGTFKATGAVTLTSLGAATASDYPLCVTSSGVVVRDNYGATGCVSANFSTLRFKHDIATLSSTSTLAEVLALRPVSFVYNEDIRPHDRTTHVGFVAEEVNEIDPRLVQYEEDGVTPIGLQYGNFAALLVGATQELHFRLEELATTTEPAADTFAGRFFTSLFARITAWLADAANGIGDFFAARIHTDELCVKDVCVSRDQFLQMVERAGASPTMPASVAPSVDSEVDTVAPVEQGGANAASSSTVPTTAASSTIPARIISDGESTDLVSADATEDEPEATANTGDTATPPPILEAPPVVPDLPEAGGVQTETSDSTQPQEQAEEETASVVEAEKPEPQLVPAEETASE